MWRRTLAVGALLLWLPLSAQAQTLSGDHVALNLGPTWRAGHGSPEGVATAPVGAFYSDVDAGGLLWRKATGAGNTGWLPFVTSVAGRTGAVVLTAADIGAGSFPSGAFTFTTPLAWTNVSKTSSSLADLATRSASDLSTGTLALARGGTGSDLSATGGAGYVLKQSSAGAAITVAALTDANLPFGAPAARGAIITANSTPAWAAYALGTAGKVLRSDGTDALWSVITIPASTAKGDILVSTDASVLGSVAAGTTSQVLIGGGASTVPAWGQVANDQVAAGAAIVDTKLATISTAGKVSDSALSSNVPLLNINNTFTGTLRSGHVAIGAAPRTDTIRYAYEAFSDPTEGKLGIYNDLIYSATTGANSYSNGSFFTYVELGPGNSQNWTASPISLYGYQVQHYVNAGATGNVTGLASFVAGGTVSPMTATTYYGLYLDTVGGTITNNYGVYQVNTSAKNYFGGSIGVGASPAANTKLDLHLGTYQDFRFQNPSTYVSRLAMGYMGSTDRFAYFDYDIATDGLTIGIYNAAKVTILNSGNTGFGFTAPIAKVAINGGLDVGDTSDPGDNNLGVVGNANIGGSLTFGTTIAMARVADNVVGLASGDAFATNYTSGWAGSGYHLDYNQTYLSQSFLELDRLSVRGIMSVYELMIHQLRMSKGSTLFTDDGKAKTVTDNGGGSYTFETETDHGFAADDLIRAQRFTGTGVYQSDLTVSSVADSTHFTAALRATYTVPAVGMEFGRLGSTSNTNRQGTIYLTTDDTDAPYISVQNGVASFADWGTAAKTKTVIGRLKTITSTDEYGIFAGTPGATGSGHYVIFSDQTAEIHNVPLSLYNGSDQTLYLNPTYSSFAQATSSASALTYTSGVGCWSGIDAGAFKWRCGDPAGQGINWNGSTLNVNGNITVEGFVADDTVAVDGVAAATVASGAARGLLGLDANGNPALPHTATPSGSGLFLGSDYMGYYTASAWQMFLSPAGFYLGGASGPFTWTAATSTGTIAGWTYNATAMTKTASGNTIGLDTGGTNIFYAGPTGAPTFAVTPAGVLIAHGAIIDGNLTASSIDVSAITDNLIGNPGAENGSLRDWSLAGGADQGFSASTSSPYSGAYAFKLPAGTSGYGFGYRAVPVIPARTYTVRLAMYGSSARASGLVVYMLGKIAQPATCVTWANKDNSVELLSNAPIPATWTVYEFTYTVPAGILWASPVVWNDQVGPTDIYFDAVEFRPQLRNVHIEDGAINAVKMTVVGGWTWADAYLKKDTGTDATSSGMAPSDWPFYAGATYANRATAPFRVSPAGSGYFTGSVTITGGSGYANISDKPTLGTLAAKNAVDLSTAEVTNKSLANVDGTANTKLNGIEAGATVTSTHTSADTSAVGGLASSSVAGWAMPAHTTYIDGGDIYTGTVTANSITANTITASQIAANTITASQLAATAIDAMTITGATIRTATGTGNDARVEMTSAGFKGFDGTAMRFSVLTNGSGTLGTNGVAWTTAGVVTAAGWTFSAGKLTNVTGGNTVTLEPAGTYAMLAGPTGAPTFTVTPAGVATLIGATFQSAASGARVVLDPTSFRVINAAAVEAATVDGLGITLGGNAETGYVGTGVDSYSYKFRRSTHDAGAYGIHAEYLYDTIKDISISAISAADAGPFHQESSIKLTATGLLKAAGGGETPYTASLALWGSAQQSKSTASLTATAITITGTVGGTNNLVLTSRTINGYDLSANRSLSASDVGAVPTSRTINGYDLTANRSLSAGDIGAVPTSTTVNGHALTGNIDVTQSDLSLADLTVNLAPAKDAGSSLGTSSYRFQDAFIKHVYLASADTTTDAYYPLVLGVDNQISPKTNGLDDAGSGYFVGIVQKGIILTTIAPYDTPFGRDVLALQAEVAALKIVVNQLLAGGVK
jgi:hypothetical protein